MVTDFRSRLGEWQSDLNGFVLTASTPHYPGKAEIENALSRIAQQLAIRDSFAFIEGLLAAKDDWLDMSEDIHDLVNFYKTQISAWRKLLLGLDQFSDNREALNKDSQAAAGLAELIQIRDNLKPYRLISKIEPLLASITSANEQLAKVQREKALQAIEEKIIEVQSKLAVVSASPDLSNKALLNLQDLKKQISNQVSIAQILYLQAQAGEAMDEAFALIEVSQAIPVPPGGGSKPQGPGQTSVPPPPVKTTHVIRAAELSSKTYLETEADVDVYIEKLKAALLEAVRSGQIARIQ